MQNKLLRLDCWRIFHSDELVQHKDGAVCWICEHGVDHILWLPENHPDKDVLLGCCCCCAVAMKRINDWIAKIQTEDLDGE